MHMPVSSTATFSKTCIANMYALYSATHEIPAAGHVTCVDASPHGTRYLPVSVLQRVELHRIRNAVRLQLHSSPGGLRRVAVRQPHSSWKGDTGPFMFADAACRSCHRSSAEHVRPRFVRCSHVRQGPLLSLRGSSRRQWNVPYPELPIWLLVCRQLDGRLASEASCEAGLKPNSCPRL